MGERWQQPAFGVFVVVLVLGFWKINNLKKGLDNLGIELPSGEVPQFITRARC
jgi:hypothetical protein